MSILSIVFATAAGFASGAVWYMTLAKPWMAAVGKTEDEVKANQSPLAYVIAMLASFLTAGMMRHIFAASGISGVAEGLVAGLGVGLFISAPWILTNYAFADRPRTLWWIDAGHTALACTAIGAVLGAFG